jgi:hypothetical protein
MDSRVLGAAIVGLLLADASARQVGRASTRAMERDAKRQVFQVGYRWQRRADTMGAGVKGSLGLLVLLYALRRGSLHGLPGHG